MMSQVSIQTLGFKLNKSNTDKWPLKVQNCKKFGGNLTRHGRVKPRTLLGWF